MIVDRIAYVTLLDLKKAFLTREYCESQDRDVVDDLECEGYEVSMVDLLSISVQGSYHVIRLYDKSPPKAKTIMGNSTIYVNTFTHVPESLD